MWCLPPTFSGLAWYENLDGAGTFGVAQVVSSTLTNNRSVAAADLDGDNDLDLVAGSSVAETVTWYENTDGLGTFGPQQIIAGAALAVSCVAVADLDGDDDMDVLAGTNAEDKIVWYENLDGVGTFGTEC
ncbi:MAG: VCBS repeat-containing protein [Alteromonas sp.]|nr:VCBS repeat-containing protein [Alteromonas sp.]